MSYREIIREESRKHYSAKELVTQCGCEYFKGNYTTVLGDGPDNIEEAAYLARLASEIVVDSSSMVTQLRESALLYLEIYNLDSEPQEPPHIRSMRRHGIIEYRSHLTLHRTKYFPRVDIRCKVNHTTIKT